MTSHTDTTDHARAIWALGDYGVFADEFMGVAETLCDDAGVGPGNRVLDVATGAGNVAIAAATRGAEVTALDLTPRMLELAAGRAAERELDIRWVEADAEDMPLPSGGFDTVLSACGVMFVPHPDVVVRQMRRVLRSGGTIALATWTPDSYWGVTTEICKRWLPPDPSVPEPNQWGREEVCRQRLEPHFDDVRCLTRNATWAFESPRAACQFVFSFSPPHVAALRALAPVDASNLVAAVEDYTRESAGGDLGVSIEIPFLVAIGQAR